MIVILLSLLCVTDSGLCSYHLSITSIDYYYYYYYYYCYYYFVSLLIFFNSIFCQGSEWFREVPGGSRVLHTPHINCVARSSLPYVCLFRVRRSCPIKRKENCFISYSCAFVMLYTYKHFFPSCENARTRNNKPIC